MQQDHYTMKVLYDHQAFGEYKVSGVSRCFVELIKKLPQDVEYQIALKENSNLYISESGIARHAIPAQMNRDTFVRKSHLGEIWGGRLYRKANVLYPFVHTTEAANRRNSISLLEKGDFDVFHPTFFADDYFLNHLHGKPWVLTIHDMVTERYSPTNNFQNVAKRNLVNKADAIVAISENTKKDIMELLNVPSERIVVIPHGSPEAIKIDNKRVIEEPYFLYVGARAGYKNFNQTIIDFSEFSQNHPEVKLVCTWKEFNDEESLLISKCKLQDKIIHLYASDQELANLYANAVAFIYPSVYEGFGLPVLEAYTYRSMCLLNNASCFPEVGGKGAIYFDSVEGRSNLPKKMEEVYTMSQDDKIAYIEGQKEMLDYYTWEKAAIKMSNLYKSLV